MSILPTLRPASVVGCQARVRERRADPICRHPRQEGSLWCFQHQDPRTRTLAAPSAAPERDALVDGVVALPERWVDAPILGIDLETTGQDPATALPVSFALVETVGGEQLAVERFLVDPGVPIPEKTTEIHGISDEMVAAEGIGLDEALDLMLGRLLGAAESKVPVAGMNLRYDLSIIDRLARERRGAGLRAQGWDGIVLDALVLDRHVDRFRKGHRRLGDLAGHYDVPLEDAHEAGADTLAAVGVVLEIGRRYPDLGGVAPAELVARQARWHREWAAGYNEWRQRRGEEPLPASDLAWPLLSDAVA